MPTYLTTLRKVILAFVVSGVVGVVLVWGFVYRSLNDTFVQLWQRDQSTVATILARRVEHELDMGLNELQFVAGLSQFATLPGVDKIDRALNGIPSGIDGEKRTILDNLRHRFSRFSVLFVLLPNGDHYLSHPFSVQRSLRKYNLSDRPYFGEATRTRAPVISDSFFGADGVLAVAIDVPILNSSGEIISHLGGVFHLSHLSRLVESDRIGAFDSVFIVDRKHHLIAHTDKDLVRDGLRERFVDHPLLKTLSHDGSINGGVSFSLVVDPIDGEEYLTAMVPLKSGWVLGLARSKKALDAGVTSQVVRTSVLVAVILFGVGVVGVVVAGRIGRRLGLADEALLLARDELELRVEDRTAELAASNRRLEDEMAERGRAEAEIRRNLIDREVIAEILRCSVETGSLQAIFDRTLALLVGNPELGLVPRACIYLVDAAGTELHMAAHRAMEPEILHLCSRVPFAYCLCGRAAAEGILLRGDSTSPLHDVTFPGMDEHGHYCMPIKSEERVVGLLNCYVPIGHVAEPREVGFIATIADTLAGVIRRHQAEVSILDYQKNLERMVQERTDELASVNTELRNFAYIISHDLRSPLASVRGFSNELGRNMDEMRRLLNVTGNAVNAETWRVLAPILDERIPEALEFIVASVEKMDTLVAAVLTLSRLGRRDLTLEPVALKRLIEDNVKALAFQVGAGSVVVEDIPDVVSDRMALEQIFGNLLSNAVKYAASGRPIRIRVTASEDQDAVIVRVEDNGRGISPRDLERIFDIFQRGSVLDIPGEGMGLTYAQTLAKRLGGRIWCESRPGEGSTFHVLLPRAPEPR